jgi:hypothetical protein
MQLKHETHTCSGHPACGRRVFAIGRRGSRAPRRYTPPGAGRSFWGSLSVSLSACLSVCLSVSGLWSLVSGLWSLVSGLWSLVSCLLYLISYLLSLVSCLLSLVSCLLSLVSCLLSLVSFLFSLFSFLLSLVACLLSLVSCLLSLVSCLLSLPLPLPLSLSHSQTQSTVLKHATLLQADGSTPSTSTPHQAMSARLYAVTARHLADPRVADAWRRCVCVCGLFKPELCCCC